MTTVDKDGYEHMQGFCFVIPFVSCTLDYAILQRMPLKTKIDSSFFTPSKILCRCRVSVHYAIVESHASADILKAIQTFETELN